MKLLADYHVHSKFSGFFHGKNTIEELARAANAVGLKEIAITDHGFKHLFGTTKSKIKKARQIIDEINEWSSTKVLLGIEADIIAEDGTIDVDNETLALLDILIVGYHRMIKTDFAGYFGKTDKTEESKQKCTNAFVNAIKRYPVTIVSHLDSVLTTDLYEVGRACAEKGAMIEINERHTNWTKEQFDELVASDCMFVVNSDAHRREDVGEVDKCLEMIKKYNIPTENIANVKFEMFERSEKDLELEAFTGFYQHQLEEKKLQEEEERAKQIVHKETLSDEMEEALRQIAEEQGIAYKTVKEGEEETETTLASHIDELFMIKEAQDFMSQNKLQEFNSQNEKLEEVEEVAAEEQPVVEQKAETPVVQTPVEPEKVEEQLPTSEKVDEPVVEATANEKPVQNKEAPKDASDVLNIAVKPAKPAEKPKAEPKQVVTKTKTTTITRTPTTQKSVVSRTTTSKSTQKITVEKNEKPAAKKTTKARGGFIDADAISGASEKKKPASK